MLAMNTKEGSIRIQLWFKVTKPIRIKSYQPVTIHSEIYENHPKPLRLSAKSSSQGCGISQRLPKGNDGSRDYEGQDTSSCVNLFLG